MQQARQTLQDNESRNVVLHESQTDKHSETGIVVVTTQQVVFLALIACKYRQQGEHCNYTTVWLFAIRHRQQQQGRTVITQQAGFLASIESKCR